MIKLAEIASILFSFSFGSAFIGFIILTVFNLEESGKELVVILLGKIPAIIAAVSMQIVVCAIDAHLLFVTIPVGIFLILYSLFE